MIDSRIFWAFFSFLTKGVTVTDASETGISPFWVLPVSCTMAYPFVTSNLFISPTLVSFSNAQFTIGRLLPIPGMFSSSSVILFTGLTVKLSSFEASTKSEFLALDSNFVALVKT